MQQAAAAAGVPQQVMHNHRACRVVMLTKEQHFIPPGTFYGPAGQQAGMVGAGAGGRGGMPFGMQQGMVLPGMQAGRAGGFPGMQGQQGGRGGAQQMPLNAFGMPGQMPFGPMSQAAAGYPPYAQAQAQAAALAQAQAQLGRGGQGGRGQMPGMGGMGPMPGMQGMQPMTAQNMGLGGPGRGRGGRDSQFPGQGGRGGGPAMGMSGQMGGFPQQGRPMAGGPMNQPGPAGAGSSSLGADAIASAPPHQQKQLLGEALFPKIQGMQPELAGKITGMLLEMENSELISL